MDNRFLLGAFALFVSLTLLVFWLIRGGLFTQRQTTLSPTPFPTASPLPTPLSTPSPSPRVPVGLGKTASNSELGLTFSFPTKFNLIVFKQPPTTAQAFTNYNFIFTINPPNYSGFEIFAASHQNGRFLSQILDEEAKKAAASGGDPVTFEIIQPLGNSLESAKFTSGTPSLYALRTKNYVYYVTPFLEKMVLPDKSDDLTPYLEEILKSFKFDLEK